MDKTIIGHRLKAIRKVHKLTQRELGDLIGLSQTAISMIEKGELSISLDSLYKLCSELEVPITKILDVESAPDEDIAQITRIIRGLDENQRGLLLALLKTFVEVSEKKIKDTPN